MIYYEIIMYPLFLLAVIISGVAQFKVTSTFKKYSKEPSLSGKSAADVAHMILSRNGINNVKIEHISGHLTDHFDPRTNTLRLSDSVYYSSSAAAVGVAAHEAGHAIQHEVGYLPIKIRRMLVPITNFASRMSWLVIILGLVIDIFAAATSSLGYYIILGGIGLFAMTAVFQLVTLPCEFNASRRAVSALEDSGWYTDGELSASRKVLSAAAMTYVAALFVTLVQVFRLIVIFGGRRNRR